MSMYEEYIADGLIEQSILVNSVAEQVIVIDDATAIVLPTGPRGLKGDTGASGTPNWLGPWDPDTNYSPGDAVTHQGSSYVSNDNILNDEPPSPNWDVLAERGADGGQGEPGPPGDPGPGSVQSVTDDGGIVSIDNTDEDNPIINNVALQAALDLLTSNLADEITERTAEDLTKADFNDLDNAVTSTIGAIFDYRTDVVTITNANITLNGLQTIRGVTLTGDPSELVLVKNQTLGQYNGVYVPSAGAWTRWAGADQDAEMIQGFTVRVHHDDALDDGQYWILLTDDIVVGTTPQTWAEVSSLAPIMVAVLTGFVELVESFEDFFTTFSAQFKGGSGSPEGVITADPGSVYFDQDGVFPSLYTKKSGTGNTGWEGVVTQEQLTELVQDIVGAFITSSGILTATYDDSGNIETIGVSTEAVQDALASFFPDTSEFDFTYDDSGNAIGVVLKTASIATSKITSFVEEVQDIVAAQLTQAGVLTVSYDDGTGAITVSVTAEAIQDALSTFFVDDSVFDWTYDDSGNKVDLVLKTNSIPSSKIATLPVCLMFALSDETTVLTTNSGNAVLTARAPYAFTLTEVRISLKTASTSGGPVTVNIKESGTTIFSTKVTIDDNEKTSTTAATAAVISDASIADDAELTFFIDDEGSGAIGLKATLIGTRVPT